jgi:hypothetical protein
MYKSTARALDLHSRTGSYATRGNARGVMRIVPRERVDAWKPEYFAGHYAFAIGVIADLKRGGFKFQEGVEAAAAVAACCHDDRQKALEFMEETIERMKL